MNAEDETIGFLPFSLLTSFCYCVFLTLLLSSIGTHKELTLSMTGLLITYVALNLMDGHGQPALLYIVPFTLGTFLTLGKKRGDLKILWTQGIPERQCPHVHFQHSQELDQDK
uniref:Uncharacterized protein MANES_01G059500 n=1 Tax=Rhizophora mucronata TaxID=61149 RepID=A0A2P2JZE2_RHIMU